MLRKALVAGTAGSLAMDAIYAASAAALDRHHAPDDVDEETEAIVATVRRLAPHVPVTLAKERPRTTGRAVHYLFGCAFALGYGRLRGAVPAFSKLGGLPYGAAVFLLSDLVLVPAAHIGRAWFRYGARERAIALGAHLAFAACLERVYSA